MVRAAAFEEDDCQERCRAAETTRTPRASTYYDSTTFGRNPAPLLPFKCSATLFPEHTSRNRVAEHYHGSSGAGLRQRVVEPKYVEALGVLVVSAARHRSWQPSSPNAAALTTSPPTPTSAARFEELAGKKCPTGTKFPERRKLDLKSFSNKRTGRGFRSTLKLGGSKLTFGSSLVRGRKRVCMRLLRAPWGHIPYNVN